MKWIVHWEDDSHNWSLSLTDIIIVTQSINSQIWQSQYDFPADKYRIYSINRPGRLLPVGAY